MVRIPFREVIGAQVVEAGHGRSTLRMQASEHTQNNMGMVHGGALCTLADAAIGTALRSALKPGDAIATIELKMNRSHRAAAVCWPGPAPCTSAEPRRWGGGDRGSPGQVGGEGACDLLPEARGGGAAARGTYGDDPGGGRPRIGRLDRRLLSDRGPVALRVSEQCLVHVSLFVRDVPQGNARSA